jgi:hypothetical protein
MTVTASGAIHVQIATMNCGSGARSEMKVSVGVMMKF